MDQNKLPLSASFRDPDGHLFLQDGLVYRQINRSYKAHYEKLMENGLYENLCKRLWLIPHEEMTVEGSAFKTIKPTQIPLISYPYEWSFSQLKDAALLTLNVQQLALQKGMSLKDASAYNVQFMDGKAIFIDTLSFELYEEGKPWVAYKQFCQHFLAPLALMAKTDIRLNSLLRDYIDGIPLDLASRLLPFSSKLSLSLGVHIHLHAKSQKQNADKTQVNTKQSFSKHAFLALIDSLRSSINKLNWQAENTEWFDYYDSNNNYEKDSLQQKAKIIESILDRKEFKTVWDLGANNGHFSRIASKSSAQVIAWDIDPACVELNYLQCKKDDDNKILPLLLDLTNPSPGIGWENKERSSLEERANADMILALGLIHHIAISNNVPLPKIAAFFAKLAPELIIEFVPKTDSQVIKLLSTRADIFDQYHEQGFEDAFSKTYDKLSSKKIEDSERSLYHFRRKNDA